MSLRGWALVWIGLIAWTAVMVLWATGPYDCSVPDQVTGEVRCK